MIYLLKVIHVLQLGGRDQPAPQRVPAVRTATSLNKVKTRRLESVDDTVVSMSGLADSES